MRFDHRFSDNDQVYVRLGLGNSFRDRPAANGVPTLDGVGNSTTDTAPNKSLSANWTRTFSPTFFNEVMFSASRSVTTLFTGDQTRQYATELGQAAARAGKLHFSRGLTILVPGPYGTSSTTPST